MLGTAHAVLLAGCQLRPSPTTYDELVTSFGSNVVSYWAFRSDGADEKGIQNAAVVGSPELNVETIVSRDTIAEGAPTDGQCIAWPGASGVYAEAAHNTAHKTPEGSIVVTFQRDTANQRSILVAADANSEAGGLSLEVTAEGSPRAFLRRQSDGAPVILVGEAGDVALNEAYTLIFKWGAAGLSLALRDERGAVVRRVTDLLTDGATGNTSPIRFGIWHDGAQSAHDGPFGRIVWLDRRIGDAEEGGLARPRTIVREITPPIGQFPFVTISNPTVTHAGVTNRPPFVASDPRSASVVDPMSGIEVFRVGGDNGADVLTWLDGSSTNSGLNFPARLRNENSPRMGNVWNADGSLLMIGRYFDNSDDPGNPCRSYIVDVTGSYTGVPWRIMRASGTVGFEAGLWWFWDPLDPLRAYIIRNSGQIDEWWPTGGPGHAVGEVNTLYGPRAGYGSHVQGRRHMINPSWYGANAGRYYITGCRETGGQQRWGGYQIDLLTGDFGPFVPDGFGDFVNNSNHSTQGTSATGLISTFQRNGNHHRFYDMTNGDFLSDTGPNTMSHIDMTIIDGVEYAVAGHSDATGFRLWDMRNGGFRDVADIPMGNPQHTGVTNTADLFETYGATGGGTTGQRYAIFTKSNDRGGHSRGIMGIRLGPNDIGQLRYLCNHRSDRTTNANEVHPQISPDGRWLVFPSNWHQPGVVSDGHVHPYVAVIPDAWWSPNNDGS